MKLWMNLFFCDMKLNIRVLFLNWRKHIISSFIQKELEEKASDAELVIMTHEATESSVDRAVVGLSELEVVNRIGNVIRVVE